MATTQPAVLDEVRTLLVQETVPQPECTLVSQLRQQLLQLVLVGLLELSGVAIVVTKRVLLKVLRPD